MNRALLSMVMLLMVTSTVYADGGHDHHAIPTMPSLGDTKITIDDHTVTLTFGPVDLPTGHDGDLASSMPKKVFQLPDDTYMIGYKSEVYTKDGKPLPKNYLHHILMLNNDKPSVSCDGEPLFFAGAMYIAPKGTKVQEMDVYQVGVNIVCYIKFGQRGADQTDEGIEIKPGVSVLSAPLKFNMDGCVKFAYPHGHDELLMVALENKSSRETLLRTVPEVGADGTFRDFRPHQVYRDDKGFTVTKRDDYEMVMVHHPVRSGSLRRITRRRNPRPEPSPQRELHLFLGV